jgi:hypothetical protein
MPLPKIDFPIHELTLPSNNIKIKYRPFLVKEKKLLLMAAETKDNDAIEQSVKQIINNCILTEKIDIEDLPSFDIDYIFLQMISKSIGEIVTARFLGDKESACDECQKDKVVRINLSEIAVNKDPDHSCKIELTDTIGIVFNYPKMKTFKNVSKIFSDEDKDIESLFHIISNLVETVYDKDAVLKVGIDFTLTELTEFFESLPIASFDKIENFFATMPTIKYIKDLTCSKCNTIYRIHLEGLEDFFALG